MILSKEELKAINDAQPPEARYGDVFRLIAQEQDAQTRQDTLREVGEWLREIGNESLRQGFAQPCFLVTELQVEFFERGEMPEQSGT